MTSQHRYSSTHLFKRPFAGPQAPHDFGHPFEVVRCMLTNHLSELFLHELKVYCGYSAVVVSVAVGVGVVVVAVVVVVLALALALALAFGTSKNAATVKVDLNLVLLFELGHELLWRELARSQGFVELLHAAHLGPFTEQEQEQQQQQQRGNA